MSASLTLETFDPEEALAAFRAEQCEAGAVVSFVGMARGETKAGGAVVNLHLQHHPRLTLPSLDAIEVSARERFAIDAVLIIHRAGDIRPGEAIVLAAAAAAHRRPAFEAVDYLMDRLKSDAIFWKREDHANGREWIEPTAGDANDLSRWR